MGNRVSICIPAYDYNGKGAEVLDFSLSQLSKQTFHGFNVVISDDSDGDNIKNVRTKWNRSLDIRYFVNSYAKGAASNTNHAIDKAPSSIIKLLCQDDYLYDSSSLKIIVDHFTDDTKWLFTTYTHTKDRENYYRFYRPSMNQNIELVNTLGTPSGLTFRKMIDTPRFDEKLAYHYDCDFYKRMYQRYGLPKIIDPLTMVNYIWDGSITSSLTEEQYSKEVEYIRSKYMNWPI